MTGRRRAGALAILLVALTGCDDSRAPSATASSALPSRVVTLAPHLAELVVAAGAGERLVGVSAYTDYPPDAAALPVVGDAFAVDREQLALLDPDLLLAWESGTPAHVVDALRDGGFAVEVVRTRGLEDVADALERVGALLGTAERAAEVAAQFRADLAALAAANEAAPPIRAFYQISSRPLYTVSGAHYISELMQICGADNVFADLTTLAPAVDVEAVIARDPEVLLAAGDAAFDDWSRWPEMAANRHGNHFRLPAGEIGRASPRLVAAGEAMCAALAVARQNRDQKEQ